MENEVWIPVAALVGVFALAIVIVWQIFATPVREPCWLGRKATESSPNARPASPSALRRR